MDEEEFNNLEKQILTYKYDKDWENYILSVESLRNCDDSRSVKILSSELADTDGFFGDLYLPRRLLSILGSTGHPDAKIVLAELIQNNTLEIYDNVVEAITPTITELAEETFRYFPLAKNVNDQLNKVRFMPEKLPERISQLAERYQDNFGELNYHIFRPSTQFKFFPSILNMQQAILTSNLFSAIKKEKLCGKFVSSYKFIGNYPEEFEEYFHGRGPVVTQVRGYVKAFFYPPHGLSLKLENAIELFVEINDALLGEMSEDNLHIAQWSTEFSQDFINEIWDFCWTVWSQQKKWLLLIYGTSTD